MALGAGARDLLHLVLRQGLTLTTLGLVLGAAVSLCAAGLMRGMLYQVSPRDPLAFFAATAVMFCAALAACLAPALRAARTDPNRALAGRAT